MPPVKKDGRNRHIKDFFKPFTIPKHRIPINDVEEDEIVLAPARERPSNHGTSVATSPSKRLEKDTRVVLTQSSPPSSALTILSSSSVVETVKPQDEVHGIVSTKTDSPDVSSTSPSPPNSQRRYLAAVEVPSPKPARRNGDPAGDSTILASTAQPSFSSTSSLTSIPVSTQSSSRRIVKNGMHAVTNSDSGSAESSSSSSDDELAPVTTFVPRKRPKLGSAANHENHAANTPNTIKPGMRQSVRLSKTNGRSSRASTPRRDATPPRTAYKHSLLNMVKQREREEKAEARMQQLEAEFEESERQQDHERTTVGQHSKVKNAGLTDDSDEAERMELAMLRTERVQENHEVFYFRGLRDDFVTAGSLPEIAQSDSRQWVQKWQDESWRIQASLTGFMAHMVTQQSLPSQLREWLVQQILHGQREELCDAYAGILEAMKQPDLCGGIMSLADFYHVQTSGEKKRRGSDSPPCASSQPRGLAQVILVVRHFTAMAGDHAIAPFIVELMHAAIDETVRSDPSLQILVAESVEHVLEHVHDEDNVLALASSDFNSSTLSTSLKCRAILALPGCSKPCHALRRYLALRLICGNQSPAKIDSEAHVDAILDRLKNAPEFDISDSTDYVQLHLLTSVLDLAIDAGFNNSTLRSHDRVDAAPGRDKANVANEGTLESDSEAEKIFNKQIDSFILQLTLTSNRIKGAGAAHLHRAEAKHALDRLAKRLDFGVRTKPRPQKKTFGGVTGNVRQSFFQGFLNRPELTSKMSNGNEDRALDMTDVSTPDDD